MTPRTFEPTVYQTFDRQDRPEQRRAAAQGAAGRARRRPASMPSSSPAPMPIAASRCRRAKRASPTSPASPARPASPSSGSRRPALFIDSRYTLQAPAQTDTKHGHGASRSPQASLSGQIADYVPTGGKIGYDPWLHTPGEIKRPRPKSSAARATLVADRQPRRPHLDRPPGRAGDARSSSSATTAPARPPQDKLADLRKVARRGQGRRRRAHPARVDLLALQHARPRRAQHARSSSASPSCRSTGQPTVYLDKKKITADVREGPRGRRQGRRRRRP